MDYRNCHILLAYNQQSPDIAIGLFAEEELNQGAGDQGLMFGYACDDTPDFMPAPIWYSHRLVQRQSELRRDGRLPWLRPDAKSQVTFRYIDGKAVEVDTIVFSTQHSKDIEINNLREAVIEEIIKPSFPDKLINNRTKFLVNPTGRFVIGGPKGDCGITGRKIIVDTYGGACPHGGGAFSGKDPSKVDRSASYMARYIAKNIVASGITRKCQVQISYAIGIAEPINVSVYTGDAYIMPNQKLSRLVCDNFDLRPKSIINLLKLQRPIYSKTATYGHFGRSEPEFTWENIDQTAIFRDSL
ncbi:S-adenosylmethionine synthetase [Angomonas deanei]|nr:S-adenosylmethionine synthetase [Angomonas deanei]EPY41460.1 S-adenosylmethionine synthetase [Angomonas deanei]|eukprot:EPY29467.1 S-adenosylmethionine synthetase [Angomonas deanei]